MLRLSSQSRPASIPFCAVSVPLARVAGAAPGDGGGAGACRGNVGAQAGFPLRGNAGRERFCGVAGGNRHIAVRRDPHREFGIHQIEALGAQPSHQQRRA